MLKNTSTNQSFLAQWQAPEPTTALDEINFFQRIEGRGLSLGFAP